MEAPGHRREEMRGLLLQAISEELKRLEVLSLSVESVFLHLDFDNKLNAGQRTTIQNMDLLVQSLAELSRLTNCVSGLRPDCDLSGSLSNVKLRDMKERVSSKLSGSLGDQFDVKSGLVDLL